MHSYLIHRICVGAAGSDDLSSAADQTKEGAMLCSIDETPSSGLHHLALMRRLSHTPLAATRDLSHTGRGEWALRTNPLPLRERVAATAAG